jgi:ubiquinone/menaquinone biosynthesis C-methylase UbiE
MTPSRNALRRPGTTSTLAATNVAVSASNQDMTRNRLRSLALGVGIYVAASVLLFGQAGKPHPVSGRVIAGVMGHEGAPWLDRPEREAEERPSRAIEELRLTPGMVVADFGAGSGYYTERLARAVGPSGKVFAVDLQSEMLEMVGARAKKLGLTNIELVRSTPDDPRLPAGAVDLILMVDVYHELAAPQRVLRAMKAALSPRGRIAIVEFRKEDPNVPIREEHKMSVKQAVQEFGAEGYELDRRVDSLPWQHLLLFKPR